MLQTISLLARFRQVCLSYSKLKLFLPQAIAWKLKFQILYVQQNLWSEYILVAYEAIQGIEVYCGEKLINITSISSCHFNVLNTFMHGVKIPECILSLPRLSVFHAASNAYSGTIYYIFLLFIIIIIIYYLFDCLLFL